MCVTAHTRCGCGAGQDSVGWRHGARWETARRRPVSISLAQSAMMEFGSLRMGQDIQSRLKTLIAIRCSVLEFLPSMHLVSAWSSATTYFRERELSGCVGV